MDLPAGPLLRPTDRTRRLLRQAQGVGAALAVLVAIGVGVGTDEREVAFAGSFPVPVVLAETMPAPSLPGMSKPVDEDVARPAPPVDDVAPMDAGRSGSVLGSHASAFLAGTVTLFLGWLLLAAGVLVARVRLDARDRANWGAEWARVEPVWSGRVR